MKTQLNYIGLACNQTTLDNIGRQIDEAKANIPSGRNQAFGIYGPADDNTSKSANVLEYLKTKAQGEWELHGFGHKNQLGFILVPEHFEWLHNNQTGFSGSKNENTYQHNLANQEQIRHVFVDVASSATAAVIDGVSHETLDATFSNIIAPVHDGKREYDKKNTRYLYLVKDYHARTGEAEKVAAIRVDYHLKVDTRKKEDPEFSTYIHVEARGVSYTTVEALVDDYDAVKNHFSDRGEIMHDDDINADFPVQNKVKIFKSRPDPNSDTFNKGIPEPSTDEGNQVATILYAPDLQNIGSIDNSKSPVTTTYSKSVTQGFTFSTTQQIKVGANFEVGYKMVKGSLSVELSISFTEQYSKQTTETMQFSVPPGKKAFTYQGFMTSEKLIYDVHSGEYNWGEKAEFLTNVLATSEVPVDGHTTRLEEKPL